MGTSRRRCEPRAGPARTLCYSVLLCARGDPSRRSHPRGGTAHPTLTHRSLAHPPGPPRAGPAAEALASPFFSTGMFLHAVHRVHARGGPGHPTPPTLGSGTVAGRPRPVAAPSQPSPPSPPHGAGAVVVGNKSSLSVEPRGRHAVLRVPPTARGMALAGDASVPALPAVPWILIASQPTVTHCCANESRS